MLQNAAHFTGAMPRATLCVFFLASAILSPAHTCHGNLDTFRFGKPVFSSFSVPADDQCAVCYGLDECSVINQPRCEFYSATTELVVDNDEAMDPELKKPKVKAEVDRIMFDLVEDASPLQSECIPYISQYTDCTKENICLGCRSCSCSGDGHWICSIISRCFSREPFKFDHKLLAIAIEACKQGENIISRRKRQAESTTETQSLSFEDIKLWMYDTKPRIPIATTETKFDDIGSTKHNADLRNNDNSVIKLDPDYVAFDDVLNNVDTKTNQLGRQKILNTTVKAEDNEYIDFENIINDINNNFDEGNTHTATENSTKVVIDFLAPARKKIKELFGRNTSEKYVSELDAFATDNDIDFNVINIVKRELTSNINSTSIIENTYTPAINTSTTTSKSDILNVTESKYDTDAIEQLKSDVYIPLSKVIFAKENELAELLEIKDKLAKTLNIIKEDKENFKVNNTTVLNDNTKDSYFSFYNLEILPAYRRTKSSLTVTKLFDKLRHDISLVVKDFTMLQKSMGTQNLPPDLKSLIETMKHFHNKVKAHLKKKKSRKFVDNKYAEHNHVTSNFSVDEIARMRLLKILSAIDNNEPQENILASLSAKAKIIIKRVLKIFSHNESLFHKISLASIHYNLTNEFVHMGTRWHRITANIDHCDIADKLYYMKYFHLILMSDISKMNDALALTIYSNRRAITYPDDRVMESHMERINTDLKEINDIIVKIIRIPKNRASNSSNINILYMDKPDKKTTFTQKLKDLISSKKDFFKRLFHRRIHNKKTEQTANQNRKDIKKSKPLISNNIMENLQVNINRNTNRSKRSVFDIKKMKERIKNILPKYLRSKVHSGINHSPKKKQQEHRAPRKQNKKNPPSTTQRIRRMTRMA